MPGSKFVVQQAGARAVEIISADPQARFDRVFESLSKDSLEVFASHKHKRCTYEIQGANESVRLEVFLEFVSAPPRLLIFGAGHDAPALAQLASAAGMQVSVFDHRKAFALPSRFPGAFSVRHYRPDELQAQISANCFCVPMSHNFLVDKAVLAALMQYELNYIGVSRPKLRTQRILDELKADGVTLSKTNLKKLHAPSRTRHRRRVTGSDCAFNCRGDSSSGKPETSWILERPPTSHPRSDRRWIG